MDLVERVRALLTSPDATWATIKQEPASVGSLFVPYLCILAVIPAFANFMAWSVPGMGSMGSALKLPLASALELVLTQYLMTLVMVLAWGWIISTMARAFGGEPSLINGVKLAVYASTPALLGGVFNAMPGLSFLALAGGAYALYLVYLGLPVLMGCPNARALPYLVVTSLVAMMGSLLISMTSAWFVPGPWLAAPETATTPSPTSAPTAPAAPPSAPVAADSTVVVPSPTGENRVVAEGLQDMARRLEAMAAAQEKAQKEAAQK